MLDLPLMRRLNLPVVTIHPHKVTSFFVVAKMKVTGESNLMLMMMMTMMRRRMMIMRRIMMMRRMMMMMIMMMNC